MNEPTKNNSNNSRSKSLVSASPLPDTKPLVAVRAGKKNNKRGRKKERTQISVRIDKMVMDIAHKQIEHTGMRITDLIERGLLLAVREMGSDDPVYHHARLILRDEGVEFSRFILDANIIRRMIEVRKLSAGEEASREFLIALVHGARRWPSAESVLLLMGAGASIAKEA